MATHDQRIDRGGSEEGDVTVKIEGGAGGRPHHHQRQRQAADFDSPEPGVIEAHPPHPSDQPPEPLAANGESDAAALPAGGVKVESGGGASTTLRLTSREYAQKVSRGIGHLLEHTHNQPWLRKMLHALHVMNAGDGERRVQQLLEEALAIHAASKAKASAHAMPKKEEPPGVKLDPNADDATSEPPVKRERKSEEEEADSSLSLPQVAASLDSSLSFSSSLDSGVDSGMGSFDSSSEAMSSDLVPLSTSYVMVSHADANVSAVPDLNAELTTTPSAPPRVLPKRRLSDLFGIA